MPRRREPLFYEAAPDPRNRPSVDMLITKLRKMSNLQNKPEAVQLVIDDMMHHYFIDEEPRPARLWQLAISAMYKFMMITGQSFPNREHLVAGGVEPEQLGGIAGNEFGDSPAADTAAKPSVDLDDEELKKGVAHVIMQHRYLYTSNECSCGRPYPTHAEWAKHVRIRIWRYLQDEFRGD